MIARLFRGLGLEEMAFRLLVGSAVIGACLLIGLGYMLCWVSS